MVQDRLESASIYSTLSPRLAQALHHLQHTDWARVAEGRHDVDGDRLFAIVSDYETRASETVPWEAHRRYIDVQYVVSGRERIGYAPLASLAVGDYDPGRDMVAATGDGECFTLRAGEFAILWPQDAHRPGIVDGATATQVRKVVLKVAVD